MPEVISNTSPIQYLFQAEHLDLLPTLYGSVTVPEAVAQELDVGRRLGVSLPDLGALSWVRVSSAPHRDILPMAVDLGAGEREVLALAVDSRESLALLDDALARHYAKVLGISFTAPWELSCAPKLPDTWLG